MRKRELKAKNYVCLAVAVALVVAFFVVHRPMRLVRCALIPFNDGFMTIAEEVYVPVTMEETVKQELLTYVAAAKERNTLLYGSMVGNPTIIVTSESGEAEKFYGNDAGVAHYSVFGNFVVIGCKGINVDIISHEMAHSELAARVGWHEANRVTPWFNEGLATQVDTRFIYSDQVWDYSTDFGANVRDIRLSNAFKEFYCEETDRRLDNYVLSRHEVGQWLNVVGTEGLLELIEEIKDGKDLNTSYKRIYALGNRHQMAEK